MTGSASPSLCVCTGMGMPGLVLILLVWQTTRAVVHATSIRGRQHACFDHQSFGEVNSTVVVHHDKSFDHFLSELAGVLEQHHLPKRPINWVFDEDAPLARPHPECHGQWLEFGVYKGGTLNSAAEYRHKYCGQDSPPLYGFDTFTGLPEDWDNPVPEMDMKKGAFSLAGRLPDVRSNVQLVEGIFSDSLPLFLHAHYHEALHVADITYLHIDCDLYQGAIDVLSLLSKHIAPGCILIFDELLNYAAYRDHEAKALWEWLKATQRRIEIIGILGPLPGQSIAVDLNAKSDLGGLYQSVAFKVL